MGKTLIVAIMAVVATLFAAAWLYCWYNKDRYQFVQFNVNARYHKTIIFDRNKGTVYDGESKIDYPAAKTENRKFDIRN